MNQVRKIRILQIITLASWGGAPQVVFDLVKGLNHDEFAVDVACGTGRGWQKMEELGVKIFKLADIKRSISPISDLKTVVQLYRIIKNGNYDIVHCHSTKAGLLGRIAARFAGVPKIYFTVHGWGFYNQNEYKLAEKPLLFAEKFGAGISTKIVCVSDNDRKQALVKKIAPENKLILIYNGIGRADVGRQEARKKMGIKSGEIVFGTVARLSPQKNPLLFLAAAKEINEQYPKIKFVLIGDGPLEHDCREFVDKQKIKEAVLFFGEKTNHEVREMICGFDVFVLTSRFEGLPLAIIEAMFAGLPVLASDVGGVSELVIDKKSGLLFESDSLGGLTRGMEYFINEPGRVEKMGCEGKKIASSDFNLEKMIANYAKLYKDN